VGDTSIEVFRHCCGELTIANERVGRRAGTVTESITIFIFQCRLIVSQYLGALSNALGQHDLPHIRQPVVPVCLFGPVGNSVVDTVSDSWHVTVDDFGDFDGPCHTVGCNDLPVICRGGSGKSRQWLTTDRIRPSSCPHS